VASGSNFHVYASDFDPTRPVHLSAPVKLDNATSAVFPVIGAAANGDLIVVWDEINGSGESIVARRFDKASGTWSSPDTLDSISSGTYDDWELAVDPGGNALAVWVKNDASGTGQLYGKRYTVSAGWHDPTQLTTGLDPVTGFRSGGYLASVVVDGRGRGVAVGARLSTSGDYYLEYVPFQ